MIDWSKLTPGKFEALCAELLELNDFSNIEWYGQSGGDKGRDLVATKIEEPLPGFKRERKWIIQCKRYAKKRITKAEINEFLVSAKEHEPDVVLMMITAILTPDVRDWLATVGKTYPFDIFVWESRDLEKEVRKNLSNLSTKPPLTPKSDEPVWFYQLGPSHRVYMCNEIEEVGFYIMNAYDSRKMELKMIREFIDFIRDNEITFDEGEEPENETDNTEDDL